MLSDADLKIADRAFAEHARAKCDSECLFCLELLATREHRYVNEFERIQRAKKNPKHRVPRGKIKLKPRKQKPLPDLQKPRLTGPKQPLAKFTRKRQ